MSCKNCAQRIVLEESFWTHADTDRVNCPDGEQCAQPG